MQCSQGATDRQINAHQARLQETLQATSPVPKATPGGQASGQHAGGRKNDSSKKDDPPKQPTKLAKNITQLRDQCAVFQKYENHMNKTVEDLKGKTLKKDKQLKDLQEKNRKRNY